MTDPTPHPPPPPPLPRNVKLLGLTSLLNDVASEMIFPLLPAFVKSLPGGNVFHLGLIEGVADSAASLLKLLSGALSDRSGRRKGFVVFGYTAAALARPAIAVVLAPWHLVLVRLAERIGKGVRTAPRDALIADSTEHGVRGRAFGFHRAMDHLGAAIGPLLAAAWLAWGPSDASSLRWLFAASLAPGLVVVAIVMFGLRETRRAPEPIERSSSASAPFGAGFWVYLTALVVFTLGNSSDAFLLWRAEELGVAKPLLPILWCVFHIAKSGGNLLAGRLVDKIGPRPMIFGGWLLYAVIYLAFAFATSAWHVWGLFLAYAVFYAVTEPSEKTLVASLAADENRGQAFGWFNAALGIAALPASLGFGWLYKSWGPEAAFGSGAGLALLAALILLGVRQKAS